MLRPGLRAWPVLILFSAGAASAAEPAPAARVVAPPPPYAAPAPVPAASPVPAAPAGDPSPAANAAAYCRNIADAAADARFARQAETLKKMEKELEDRIAQLEAKRAEYEAWLKRREDFARKADESVVAIYSQMRPDAAAGQISVMDPGVAAAILSKLNPRTASAILNEMDPGTAAQLTNTIAALARKPAVKGQAG